jgi:hypothetical protein
MGWPFGIFSLTGSCRLINVGSFFLQHSQHVPHPGRLHRSIGRDEKEPRRTRHTQPEVFSFFQAWNILAESATVHVSAHDASSFASSVRPHFTEGDSPISAPEM